MTENARTVTITEAQERDLLGAAQDAEDASLADSNDGEIEALREAYEAAFSVLGIKIPEGREPCEQCDEAPAVEFGMCDSCIHDARRSGWNPPSE